ncbi:MAG: TIGR04282 family arsenosugar biosynthesis glycosyltransferase [Planctomycetota bacterium]|jgi:glycosyltransferase A (GT-A) superfamily protein (DUF2064 family)
MTSRTGNGLAVFMQYPEPGNVFKNLAREIGEEKSAAVARKLDDMIIQSVENSAALFDEIFFFIYPPARLDEAEKWLDSRFICLPQTGGSAPERLKNALRLLFVKKCRRALILGTDVLGVTEATLQAALKGLGEYDCVLGPKSRGGLYLLGLPAGKLEIFGTVVPDEKNLMRALKGAILGASLTLGMLEEKISPAKANDLSEGFLE